MIEDLEGGEPFRLIRTDVCIAGAGPAGITLARGLLRRGRSVCLLESGGEDFDERTQQLYAGENLGAPYYALSEARLRFFGGTLHIWGGRNCPLDDIDFERRPWIAHSGWPLTRAALDPWYEQVHADLGLGPFAYDQRCWAELGMPQPPWMRDRMDAGFWRFDFGTGRFDLGRCEDLRASPDVTILLHANLTRIAARSDATAVAGMEAISLGGRKVRIEAGSYVLACGGIENARLLLAANDVEKTGIGNSHDQVGRYFMEHPHARAARVEARNAYALFQLFQRRRGRSDVWLAPSIKPAETFQRQDGILNTALTIKLIRPAGRATPLAKKLYQFAKHNVNPDRAGRRMWHALRKWREFTRIPALRRLRWAVNRLDGRQLYLFARGEQAPNPASRVLLGRETDELGVPRTALDWRLTALDKHSVRELVQAFARQFAEGGHGRVFPEPWLEDPSPAWPVDTAASNHPLGGYHHMGTTRMSADPRSGVVDSDCRVHGYGNLYVAGSSVFPTSGWANPTLTILALAHRLADHLARRP